MGCGGGKINDLNVGGRGKVRELREREMGSSVTFRPQSFFSTVGNAAARGKKLFREEGEEKVWFSFGAIIVGPNCEIHGSVPAALLWEGALLGYF